jgi:hypothetical protein
MDGELVTVDTVLGLGRRGAAVFAACCAERLRTLLRFVPSGAPPLVAGVALTALWRMFEELDRPDPRHLGELATACWTLVEIEPVPKVRTEHLEALVSATHGALEAYLSGNPEHALKAAQASHAVAGGGERGRQRRDAAEIAAAGDALPALATSLRERAESEGDRLVKSLIG